MSRMDELLRRKRDKEAEIEKSKRAARRDGYRVSRRRAGISGGQDLANAQIHALQEELRQINSEIDRERQERQR